MTAPKHTPGTYTRDGRDIIRDGKPFVRLQRVEWEPCPENHHATGTFAFPVYDADDLAVWLVDALNCGHDAPSLLSENERLREALREVCAHLENPATTEAAFALGCARAALGVTR